MAEYRQKGSAGYLFSIVLVAVIGGLLFGYDTAVISGAEKGLQSFFQGAKDFTYTNALHGFTTSSALIGCVIGALLSGIMASGLGRKKSLFIAGILFLKRMSDEADVHGWEYFDEETDTESLSMRSVPKHVRVYEISGPMFFGMTDMISEITVKEFTRVLVIRMRGVPALDASAMKSLEDLYNRCSKAGVKVVFSHVNAQPMKTMEKAGFVEKVGRDNFCAHIDDALERAASL